MSTILRRWLVRLNLAQPSETTLVFFGLDYSGKTTLLYLLNLGETAQTISTISTIGTNVEQFVSPTTSRSLAPGIPMVGWDIGLGCGSLRQMSGILGFYTVIGDAMVWVLDSSDKKRLDESIQELIGMIQRGEDRRVEGGKKLPWPILILANKQDIAGCIPLDDIRHKVFKDISSLPPHPVLGQRYFSVYGTSLKKPIPETGLPEAFEWLTTVLDIAKKSTSGVVNATPAAAQAPSSRETPSSKLAAQPTLQQKVQQWLTRIYEEPTPPNEFINQFNAFSLPSWDHYTHIRIAYTLLDIHGRQQGKNLIFDGLAAYIAQNPQGRTFHFTMTYFWVQIVHFGMRSVSHLQFPVTSTGTSTSTSTSTSPNPAYASNPELDPDSWRNAFARFILLNPHVVDSSLWSEYYTKEVIMTPQAKAEMVLPDKKPLPSLVVRDQLGGRLG